MTATKTKPKPKITLSEALFGAQQDAQGIKKGSRNTHHGYDYTSAEDMLQFGKAILAKHGLFVSINKGHVEVLADGSTHYVIGGYLDHPESLGSRAVSKWLPYEAAKGRPNDKSALSSNTTALNYLLRDLLLIPRGEQYEVDTRDDTDYVAPATQRATPDVTEKSIIAGQVMAALIEENDCTHDEAVGLMEQLLKSIKAPTDGSATVDDMKKALRYLRGD